VEERWFATLTWKVWFSRQFLMAVRRRSRRPCLWRDFRIWYYQTLGKAFSEIEEHGMETGFIGGAFIY